MRLVKISNEFFDKCRENNVHKELMFNEDGRPSVLIVKLKYKDCLLYTSRDPDGSDKRGQLQPSCDPFRAR